MRILIALLLVAATALPADAAGKAAPLIAPQPTLLKIVTSWSADVSSADLKALPQWLTKLHAGYFLDEAAFTAFWKVFKPGTILPQIDFTKHLVVFVARDSGYDPLFVAKVTLKDGVAEIVADGNRAGPARKDRLSVAAAVIPRLGIQALQVGRRQAPVEP